MEPYSLLLLPSPQLRLRNTDRTQLLYCSDTTNCRLHNKYLLHIKCSETKGSSRYDLVAFLRASPNSFHPCGLSQFLFIAFPRCAFFSIPTPQHTRPTLKPGTLLQHSSLRDVQVMFSPSKASKHNKIWPLLVYLILPHPLSSPQL